MRKIDKNLTNVPASLNSNLTVQRRGELIAKGVWIKADIYASRYKMNDVKTALKTLYNGKCAFCERKTFAPQVEHFRPKSIYCWLAYSWDNLLWICPNCNINKSNKFEVLGSRIVFRNTQEALDNIHKLGLGYTLTENSLLIHPEQDDITNELICLKTGKIESANQRINYTIETCRLNRIDLKDERKKIWDDLMRKIKPRLLAYKAGNKNSLQSIQDIIKDFKANANNSVAEFTVFRQYLVKNYIQTM